MLNTTINLKQNALRGFIFGFVVILLLALLAEYLFIPHAFAPESASNAFYEIEFGTSKSTLEQVLRRIGFHCRFPLDGPKHIIVCEFSDFLRDYRIAIAADTNQVVRKSFSFRRPDQLLNR